MIVIGPKRAGWLKVFKNPADAQAPYRADLSLPDGRRYTARMRSHPAGDTGKFWYEGFVTAEHPDDYARDQELVRYPVEPKVVPPRWDLLPCQIKLNERRAGSGRDHALIGSVWVSNLNGARGGELFTVLAGYRLSGSLMMAGDILRFKPSRHGKHDACGAVSEYASAA